MSENTPIEADIHTALLSRGFTPDQASAAIWKLKAEEWRRAADLLRQERGQVPVAMVAFKLRARADEIENGDTSE